MGTRILKDYPQPVILQLQQKIKKLNSSGYCFNTYYLHHTILYFATDYVYIKRERYMGKCS